MRYRTDIDRLTDRRSPIKARDGAVIDPVVDEANSIQWFFKYRKSAAGKYKWFAMGQQNHLATFSGSSAVATPAATNVPVGTAIVLPFGGYYFWRASATFLCTAAMTTNIGLSVDGSGSFADFLTNTFVASESKSLDFEAMRPIEGFAGHSWGPMIAGNVLGFSLTSHIWRIRPLIISV